MGNKKKKNTSSKKSGPAGRSNDQLGENQYGEFEEYQEFKKEKRKQ